MEQESPGGTPAAVNLVLREPWGGLCEDATIHVGHDPALLVLCRTDDSGDLTEMLIDATGPDCVDELVEWLRNIATALESGPRFDG